MTETSIRICVADDHSLFRRGIKATILATDHFSFVGEADNAQKAVELALDARPDVFLMDIQMPGGNGIEATRQIQAAQLDVKIIMLTMFEDDDSVFAALRAGARGYLLKGTTQKKLIRTIQAVANGEAVFGAPIADRIMKYFAVNQPKSGATVLPELTPREREVLQLIAQGLKNPQIAEQLVISPKTVRNHISNIFSKLHVTDRQDAIDIARDAGLGQED